MQSAFFIMSVFTDISVLDCNRYIGLGIQNTLGISYCGKLIKKSIALCIVYCIISTVAILLC